MSSEAILICVIAFVAIVVATLMHRYLPVPSDVGPRTWPSPPPPLGFEEESGPTQEEIDLWIDVLKLGLKRGQGASISAAEADRAVQQYLTRYGEDIDDDSADSSDEPIQ